MHQRIWHLDTVYILKVIYTKYLYIPLYSLEVLRAFPLWPARASLKGSWRGLAILLPPLSLSQSPLLQCSPQWPHQNSKQPLNSSEPLQRHATANFENLVVKRLSSHGHYGYNRISPQLKRITR